MPNKKSFLEKQIETVEDRLLKLFQIKTAFLLFLVVYAISTPALFLYLLSQLLSHKISKFLGILGLVELPAILIIAVVSYGYLNSLIKENKEELKTKKKQREAEVQVQEFLTKSLTEDYQVFSNIFTGYGDVDALVIGPTGVYAIEVKSNSGIVAENGKTSLTVIGGEKPRKDYRRQVIGSANMIKKLLDNATGLKTFVSPVLVFPYASFMTKDIVLESPKDNYKVPVLGVKELVEYIYSNKQTALPRSAIEKYSEVLKDMHPIEYD